MRLSWAKEEKGGSVAVFQARGLRLGLRGGVCLCQQLSLLAFSTTLLPAIPMSWISILIFLGLVIYLSFGNYSSLISLFQLSDSNINLHRHFNHRYYFILQDINNRYILFSILRNVNPNLTFS